MTEPLSIVIRLLKEESPYRWNEETGEWDFVPPQDKPSDPLDYFTGFSPDKWSDKVEGETNEQFHQRMDYSCPCGSGKTPQPNALFGGEDRCFGCIAEKTTPLVQQMFTAPTIHVEPKYNAEGHPVRSAAYGYDFRTKNAGEPMDIAFQLLKAKSKGQESLTEWTKEKWEFVGDDKKEMKKPRHKRGRYAPKSVADSMSPSQKATENKTKRAAHKKGKQHAPRGKSVKQMYRSVEGKK